MNLYLISQGQNSNYDTYDSAVVAAPDEDTARDMYPGGGKPMKWDRPCRSWCDGPQHVAVKLIGVAAPGTEQGVVCASYNAG